MCSVRSHSQHTRFLPEVRWIGRPGLVPPRLPDYSGSLLSAVSAPYNNTPNSAASIIKWMEVAESCCNSMRVDDTCCMFGSIISDHCPALNAPVAFTLTLSPADKAILYVSKCVTPFVKWPIERKRMPKHPPYIRTGNTPGLGKRTIMVRFR